MRRRRKLGGRGVGEGTTGSGAPFEDRRSVSAAHRTRRRVSTLYRGVLRGTVSGRHHDNDRYPFTRRPKKSARVRPRVVLFGSDAAGSRRRPSAACVRRRDVSTSKRVIRFSRRTGKERVPARVILYFALLLSHVVVTTSVTGYDARALGHRHRRSPRVRRRVNLYVRACTTRHRYTHATIATVTYCSRKKNNNNNA